MTSYEIRVNYSDETYEVTSIIASSITEAYEIAKSDPEVESCELLATVDLNPQSALAI